MFKKKLFVSIAVFLFFASLTLDIVRAETPTRGTDNINDVTLNVPIAGLTKTPKPAEYINVLFKWGIGLAALLALGQLVLGGVMYTLSAGNVGSKEAATERMKGSVTGLILLLVGVTILVTINPKLVNLRPIDAEDKDSAAMKALVARSKAEQKAAEARLAGSSLLSKGANDSAAAARARLAVVAIADPSADCVSAEKNIISEIDEYVANANAGLIQTLSQDAVKGVRWIPVFAVTTTVIDQGIMEVIDDTAVLGLKKTDDFREHLEIANQKYIKLGADNLEVSCYRDALISATNYAVTNFPDKRMVELLVAAFENFDDTHRIPAREYLKADPYGRKNIATNSIEPKLIDLMPDYDKKIYAGAKALIDKNKSTEAGESLVGEVASLRPGTFNALIVYAKGKLTQPEYEKFKKPLVDGKVDQINAQIKIVK
jgi:hypothetical protein